MNTAVIEMAPIDLPASELEQLDLVRDLGSVLNKKEVIQVGEEKVFRGYGNMDDHNFRPVYETVPIYAEEYVYSDKQRASAMRQLKFVYRMTTFDSVKKQVAKELCLPRVALEFPKIWGTLVMALLVLFALAVGWGVWAGIQHVLPLVQDYVDELRLLFT